MNKFTYSKKALACLFAITLAFSAFSCSGNVTPENEIIPDKEASSEAPKQVSENKKTGKNQITVYYDAVNVSGTDMRGTIPLGSFGDSVYYTKEPDIYRDDFELSSYTVDILTGEVKPDSGVSEQVKPDISGFNVTGQMEELGLSNKYLYDSCQAEDGSIYLAISEKYVSHSVYTIDENGKLKDLTGEMTDLEDYVNAIYTDKDGNIVLSTGYATVMTDVIDPKTGKTLYMYENYGVESLIGPSDKYDMVYVKYDGIYGYDYQSDSEEMIASEDLFPQLSSSFESAYTEGNLLHITLKNIGSPSIYEVNRNTGETIRTDCSGRIDSSCFSDDGTMYYTSGEVRLENSDDGYTYETSVVSVYRHEKNGADTMLFVLPQYQFEAQAGNILTDASGNLLVHYMDEDYNACVLKYDLSGNLSDTIYLPAENSFGFSLVKNERNEVFAVSGNGEERIFRLNDETNSFEEICTLKNVFGTWFSGNSGYDLFYTDTAGVYGWNRETQSSDELILWADTEKEVFSEYLMKIVSPSEVLFPEGVMLVKADEARLAELNSREIITLAVSGTGLVKPFVSEFNRTNDDYRILLRDYSKYGTAFEYNGFGEDSGNLAEDIIKGDIPDIIMLDDMDLSSFIVKGGFADLKAFADSDPDFDLSDYYQSILDAFTYKGKQYTIPAAAGSQTFLAAESLEKQTAGRMDYDAFLSLDSGDSELFQAYCASHAFLLDRVIGSYVNDYVWIEDKRCDFESGKFAALLDFIKENGRPDDEEWTDAGENCSVKSEIINELLSFDDNFKKKEWEQERFTVTGYPSESGGSRKLEAFLSFGISETSELKDGAWEFVKFILQYDYSEGDGMSMASGVQPSCISLSEKYIREAEETSAEYLNGISEESADAYRRFLNMPAYSDILYKNIMRIIREETDIFFAGERTSEETATAVQNKVSLYLNEIS